MSATVAQVLELVNAVAPFELAESWDNVGLLAGHPDRRVEKVMCALDLSVEVIEEAQQAGCGLIVTHHPILFRGRKNLCETDGEGRLLCALVRSGLSMIAAHTNFDNANPGVNDALAAALGLSNVRPLESGVRIGEVNETDFGMFCTDATARLGGSVRQYGDLNRRIRRVAVLGGAGEDYAHIALDAGADVFLTGEMAYHKALSAVDDGLCVVEAGHAATEHPAISLLCRGLQKAADAVQYDISFIESQAAVFF